MKNDRVFKRICILFLVVFLMSCAKGPFIVQQKAAIPAVKSGYKTYSTSQSRAIANQTSGSQTT